MVATDRELEEPLPRYGLAASFVGERWVEGEGWDLCDVVHRPAGSEIVLHVGVIRRTTVRVARGTPRVAVSPEVARESVAQVLVAPRWRVGDDDIFAIIERVAKDEGAWRARAIRVDGRQVMAHEREYRGSWLVYGLTPTLIVYVAAPVALRPDVVTLRKLEPGEFKPGEREEGVPPDGTGGRRRE
jgi:hypothetical protein